MVRYGAMTMVALCFANALQNGEGNAFSQAIDSFKKAFHVTDFAIGLIQFGMGAAGAFGSLPIAFLCARFTRVRVLTVMFGLWTLLMALSGLVPIISLGAVGFGLFVIFRMLTAVTEATDPAALPLIADYYPVDQRGARYGLFNGLAGFGSIIGLVLAGPLVDRYGWQGAFFMWIPFGVVGAVLMGLQPEPKPGNMDASFEDELKQLEGSDAASVAPESPFLDPAVETKWAIFVHIFKLKSWRLIALAIGVGQIMSTALMIWGIPYMKRTYHVDSTHAGIAAIVLGPPTLVGVFVGGFVADALLRRGVLRARVWVTMAAATGSGVSLMLGFSTTHEWLALSLIAVGAFFMSVPVGPAAALLIDVTPTLLRAQASALGDIIMFVSAVGGPLVGGLSTLLGDGGQSLRIALFLTSPMFFVGAALMIPASRTFVSDVEQVVLDAKHQAQRRA